MYTQEWKQCVIQYVFKTGGKACLLARIAEAKATKLLGFNVDEARLSREICAGFLDKKTALKAISNYDKTATDSMMNVLKECEIL